MTACRAPAADRSHVGRVDLPVPHDADRPAQTPGVERRPGPSGLAPHHPKERGLPPEYGGLKGDQVKRLKSLETENQRLRRAISDLTLEKLILKEAAAGPEGQRQQNF
jgi:hypothetical protein